MSVKVSIQGFEGSFHQVAAQQFFGKNIPEFMFYSFISLVAASCFGYSLERATQLMRAVHHEGHAIVATGPRETMEVHAQAMHDYGLWATVRRSGR